MQIHLRGYLTFKNQVGDRQIQLPEGVSVRQFLVRLIEELGDESGSFIQFDQEGNLEGSLVVLVNGRHANHLPGGLDTKLEDGDQIAMFPPIAGGCGGLAQERPGPPPDPGAHQPG
jgi:MoaD family protein